MARKLTDKNVKDIRSALASGRSGASIAREYDVTRQMISKIRLNRDHKGIASDPAHITHRDRLNPPQRIGAKSTEALVVKLKYEMVAGKSNGYLANKFGIGYTSISAIRTGRTWSDILPGLHLPRSHGWSDNDPPTPD